MKSFTYVLLGGGVASGYAAREFVRRGLGPGELCIITSENAVAYERPALSKEFLKPGGQRRLEDFCTCVRVGWEAQDAAWYEERGVQYFRGVAAVGVDVAGRKLSLEGGEEVTYGKLLVATGSRAALLAEQNTPGAELGGIHYIRSVEDAEGILEGIEECKRRDGRALVVGAGYVGMEVGAALKEHDLHVTMAFPGGMLMDRMLPHDAASHYEEYFAAQGVELCWDSRVTQLSGSHGHVESVELNDDKTLQASMVVVGIGSRPNVELFLGQLELINGGIEVDGSFRSSHPDVYAIGDVASFPLLRYGGHYCRQEHATHARLSAAHAVSAILDPENTADYDYVPFYHSRFFGLSWQFHGVKAGRGVAFGQWEGGMFGMYWVDDGVVVGAFLEGGTNEERRWMRAVAVARPRAPFLDELRVQGVLFGAKVAGADVADRHGSFEKLM